MNRVARASAAGLTVVPLVWLGLLLGVSFLATPAKFLAPSLTLPVALDVGRHTFAVFSAVEVAAASMLVVCAMASRTGRVVILAALLVAGLVAVQCLWLLPVLDTRVEIILQGGVPVASSLHDLYVALEVGKLVLLALLAWSSFPERRLPPIAHAADAS